MENPISFYYEFISGHYDRPQMEFGTLVLRI